MSTPHNAANPGDIAETALMPGDPLRAKHIAESYLTDVSQFNGLRGMLGFTGLYKGTRISVMGSGMGIPSIGIYSYELYKFYNVQNIIRVGTAGGIGEGVKLRDVIIAQGACTDSNFAAQYGLPGSFAPIADYALLEAAVAAAKDKGVKYRVGNVVSSDSFYNANGGAAAAWRGMGVLAVEMEAAGLYMTAAKLNRRALAILTVSDLVFGGGEATAEERQTAFTDMMEAALETAVIMSKTSKVLGE